MLTQQARLIEETWHAVTPMADQAASMFYDRLFEIDPDLRKLFARVDLASQRKKLVQAISTVVGSLDRLEQVVPHLEQLGRNHATYGVEDAHYDTVGAALLWTLEKGLGDRWAPEVEAAWVAAYTLIANTMRNAARSDCKDAPGTMTAV